MQIFYTVYQLQATDKPRVLKSRRYLTTPRKPLCLLVEEPEVGGPEEAVEEAEEDGDVAFGELGTGAAAFNSYLQKHSSFLINV